MAKSKDGIKYGTAQAKLSEDEALRVRYKHGTPLEGGKITESEPVDLFSSAHNIESNKSSKNPEDDTTSANQSQLHRRKQNDTGTGSGNAPNTSTERGTAFTSSSTLSLDKLGSLRRAKGHRYEPIQVVYRATYMNPLRRGTSMKR